MEKLTYNYHNGQNNQLTDQKVEYIRNMRLELCHEDMVHKNTGLLNLLYMNVKKGAYWSPHLTQKLKEMVCLYGAYSDKYCVYSVIKRHKFAKPPVKEDSEQGETKRVVKAVSVKSTTRCYDKWFKEFETIEIQLRICRLLKCCDLSRYAGHKFLSPEEIDLEAERNLERHRQGFFDPVVAGGVVRDESKRPPIVSGVIFNPPAKEMVELPKSAMGLGSMSGFALKQ